MKKLFKKYELKIPDNDLLKSRIAEIILLSVLFLILEFEYYNFVNLSFFQQKMGFAFEFSFLRFFIGKIMFLFVVFLAMHFRKFMYFANSILMIFLTFPAIIMFEYMPGTPLIISLSAILLHIFLLISSPVEFNSTHSTESFFNENQKIWIISITAAAALIPIVFSFGFDLQLKAFNPYKVYEIRSNAEGKLHGLTSYIYGWLIKIIIPAGLIISIKNKKYLLMALFIMAQIYLYMTEAQKSVFISLFVILIMLIKTYEKQVKFILLFLITAIVFSKILSIATGDFMMESIVVRRTFFLPSIIINDYFSFFKDTHIYLSHSIFRNYFDYPFDLAPPQLIGKEFFMNPKANVNSGFISDGFMNFGYIGIPVYLVAMTTVIKVMDFLRISPIFSGIIIIILYTFINSYFLTTLLTHGVLLFLILTFFLFRNSLNENK